MATLDNQSKGAIGEHYVLMRMLAKGYAAANANMSVGNSKFFDIFCSTPDLKKIVVVQVKSSFDKSRSFNIGLTHKDFLINGIFDDTKAMQSLESKIRCAWIFVDVQTSGIIPQFRLFIMTREQVIKLAFESEKWYINDVSHETPLKETGNVALVLDWIMGNDTQATTTRKFFKNPFTKNQFEEAWENLKLD